MTLIVEDGTGIVDANTYVSVDDHIAFCAMYGVTVEADAAQIALITAMDYIASKDYQGTKEFDTNDLDFPRLHMRIKGQEITDLQSLAKIQRVQNEFGLAAAQGVNPLAIKDRVVQSESFGPFSKTYASGQATTATNPRLDIYLKPLLKNNKGGKFSFTVKTHKYHDCCNTNKEGYSYYEGYPYFTSKDGEIL